MSLSLQDINETNRLYNCSEGGKGEILRVHICDTQQPQEDDMNYQVVIVAVDSRGMSHTLSTTAVASDSDRLEWNETLEFPISREQSWQFFQIKTRKSSGSADKVLSQPRTVVMKVGVYENLTIPKTWNTATNALQIVTTVIQTHVMAITAVMNYLTTNAIVHQVMKEKTVLMMETPV